MADPSKIKIAELEAECEALESQTRNAKRAQREAAAEVQELRDALKAEKDRSSKLEDEVQAKDRKNKALQGEIGAERDRADQLEEQLLAKIKELAMVKASSNSSGY